MTSPSDKNGGRLPNGRIEEIAASYRNPRRVQVEIMLRIAAAEGYAAGKASAQSHALQNDATPQGDSAGESRSTLERAQGGQFAGNDAADKGKCGDSSVSRSAEYEPARVAPIFTPSTTRENGDTPRTNDIQRLLAGKYPPNEEMDARTKLLYYMEAAECFGQECADLERELANLKEQNAGLMHELGQAKAEANTALSATACSTDAIEACKAIFIDYGVGEVRSEPPSIQRAWEIGDKCLRSTDGGKVTP